MQVIKVKAVFLIANEDLSDVYSCLYDYLQSKRLIAHIEDEVDEMTISEAFAHLCAAFNWKIIYDAQYNVVDIGMISYTYRSIAPYVLKAVAPYVVSDSYIEVYTTRSEDDFIWKFTGKKIKKTLMNGFAKSNRWLDLQPDPAVFGFAQRYNIFIGEPPANVVQHAARLIHNEDEQVFARLDRAANALNNDAAGINNRNIVMDAQFAEGAEYDVGDVEQAPHNDEGDFIDFDFLAGANNNR